jgi:isocitrate dehydrogenase
MIIDIGTAKMAVDPRRFDVVVAPNLYGDILSDVAAEVAGSIGIAPSSNIGRDCAMFEAVHGSAPDIGGRDLANPSGLLLSAVMMLVHLGRTEAASLVHNAWLRTLEDGVLTVDMASAGGKSPVGTRAFAQAVIQRLGQAPRTLPAVHYPPADAPAGNRPAWPAQAPAPARTPARKALVGVDVFLNWDQADRDPNVLGARLEALAAPEWRLSLVTNRGVKVYPKGYRQTLCTDHWRCRFVAAGSDTATPGAIAALLQRMDAAGLDAVKTENLYTFDGVAGYSQAQGE